MNNRTTKNLILATVYGVVGATMVICSLLGIIEMYFSSTFLPVYVSEAYVIGNQMLRYELYAVLAALIVFGAWLFFYGNDYLFKKLKKALGR